MASKSNKVRVGIFTAGAGALVAVVLVVFAGMRWWEAKDHYHVVIDDSVFGLEAGAQVLMNGIRVGTVDELATLPDDPGKVDVQISVKHGVPIRTDTRALLRFVGVTGLKVIDLRGGSKAQAALPTGSAIPMGETTIDEVSRRGQELLDKSTELVAAAQRVLTNVATVTDPTGEIVANTAIAAKNLARTSTALSAMVGENRIAVRQSLEAVQLAAQGAATLAADLDGVIRTNSSQLQSTLADVRQASRSFRELARELKQRPSRLLFSQAQKDRKLP